MPRVQKSSKPRHDPLHAQLADDEVEARYGRISQPGKRKKSKRTEEDDTAEVRFVSLALLNEGWLTAVKQTTLDPKSSRRVFELAKEQQDELAMPEDLDEAPAPRAALSQPRHTGDSDGEDDEDEDLDYQGVADIEYEEEFVSITLPSFEINSDCMQEIDEDDMHTLDALHPHNAGERKTLADLIFAKLDGQANDSVATIQRVHQGTEHLLRLARRELNTNFRQ